MLDVFATNLTVQDMVLVSSLVLFGGSGGFKKHAGVLPKNHPKPALKSMVLGIILRTPRSGSCKSGMVFQNAYISYTRIQGAQLDQKLPWVDTMTHPLPLKNGGFHSHGGIP